jgi:hypothetical protein
MLFDELRETPFFGALDPDTQQMLMALVSSDKLGEYVDTVQQRQMIHVVNRRLPEEDKCPAMTNSLDIFMEDLFQPLMEFISHINEEMEEFDIWFTEKVNAYNRHLLVEQAHCQVEDCSDRDKAREELGWVE